MRTSPVRLLGALLGCLTLLVLAACGGGSSSQGQGRLTMAAAAIPASLDPRLSSPYDATWIGLLYDSLVKRQPDGAFGPGLAESWTFSPDMRQLDLTLRSGVTFQDGTPLDGAAVKTNLDRARTTSTNFSNQLTNIESVDVTDATHVRLKLSDSGAPMLGVLSGEAGMMISPAAIDKPDLSTAPVGTGPYRLDKFVGTTMQFTAWDGYWNRPAVKLAGLDVTVFLDETARVRALRSGQVDSAFIQPLQVNEVKSAGLDVVSSPTADFYGVIVNTGKGEFGKAKVRQAMMLALDRAAIAKNVFGDGCLPSAQPFRPDDWAYVPGLDSSPAAQYDVARAKQLMAEAGVPNGFGFELQTNTMQVSTQVAQILQAQWAQIGIKVTIRPMENVQFVTARRQGQFEATMSTYITARPDQSQFVKTFYLPGGMFNPSGYSLPGVAERLAQSSSSPDVGVRTPPMHAIVTDVLNDGPPVLPICTRTTFYAHRSNVHDLLVPPMFDSNFQVVSVDQR